MKRVYISYSEQDSQAALYLATQLRGRGIDLFVDYERMMNPEGFSRRLANEIRTRESLVLIQSRSALSHPLVLAELSYAMENRVQVITLILEPIDIRASGEYAFLLSNQPIDFTSWVSERQARHALDLLEDRLRQRDREESVISRATAEDLTELTTLVGHESWIRTVAFSPDGNWLASVSNDKTLRLWDLRNRDYRKVTPQQMVVVDAHESSVWDVAFSPHDTLMASCANDNAVRIWDMDGLPEMYEFTRFVDHHEPVYSLAFSPDGNLLASASYDNSVHVRDITRIRNTGIAESIVPLLHSSHVYSVAFSADGSLLASASRDSTVRLWNVDRQNLRSLARSKPHFLIGHMSWVNTVAFSPRDPIVASTSHDKTIRLWDTTNFKEVGVLNGHKESVNHVSFSPDGSILASTSKDNTVRLWEVASGRELVSVQGHDRWVNCAVFSPDGRVLATASGDNTIKLWGAGNPVPNGAR